MKGYIKKLLREGLLSEKDKENMMNWSGSFINRSFDTKQDAINLIKRTIDHYNKQFGWLGEVDVTYIISLFDLVWTNGDIKIVPKVVPEEISEEMVYYTNDTLIEKQKQIWWDTYGLEIGTKFSKVIYVNIDKIHSTEKTYEDNIVSIINTIQNEEPLPPLLVDDDYVLFDGNHRWVAAKRLGVKKVPIIILKQGLI